MSQKPNQLAQYKDALKLLKKKCQVQETQLAESKAEIEATHQLLVQFLEFISSPFTEEHPKPEFTIDSLKQWWASITPTSTGISESMVTDSEERKQLKQQVVDLEKKVKDLEYEKNNIEYTLSRRQDEYMQVNEELVSTRDELSRVNAESDEMVSRLRKMESEMVMCRDTMKTAIFQLTELLTSAEDEMEGRMDVIHELDSFLFPEEAGRETTTESSIETPLQILISSLVLSRRKSSDLEDRLDSTSHLSQAQESQISRLEEENASLRQRVAELEQMVSMEQHRRSFDDKSDWDDDEEEEEEHHSAMAVSLDESTAQSTETTEKEQSANSPNDNNNNKETASQPTTSPRESFTDTHAAALQQIEDLEDEIDELNETNENLRRALRGAKENMEKSLQRQGELEQQLSALREEFATLEAHNAEMMNQAVLAGTQRASELEKKLEITQQRSTRLEEEMEGLRASWETSVNQYEQELAVLRSRKVAVEKQVSVSEQFLEDQTRLHRDELMKVQEALRIAEEEKKDLKCQVLEREAELESMQANGEETDEKMQALVASLREQLRSMQNKLSQQQVSASLVKKREGEMEKQLQERLTAGIQEMKEKDREIIRQQQKSYEEELSRMREQITVLTHQLEEERKGGKKMRETVAQLNELFESQDRQIEILRSDVAMRDSELLAGKEQIKKLSMLLSSRISGNA